MAEEDRPSEKTANEAVEQEAAQPVRETPLSSIVIGAAIGGIIGSKSEPIIKDGQQPSYSMEGDESGGQRPKDD